MPTEEDLDQFEQMMYEILSSTKKTGLEHGFNICKKDGKLEAGSICKGTECEVGIKECPWPNTFLQVHTHVPGAGLILSPQDIQSALASSTDFMCLGSLPSYRSKKGAFQCYKVNNDNPDNRKFIESWWTTIVDDPKPTQEEKEKAWAYIREEIYKILTDKSDILKRSKRFDMILKDKY